MQTTSIRTAPQPGARSQKTTAARRSKPAGYSVNPMTLATLDFGLFRALRSLETPRERICSALCISDSDFDYISGLTSV
jgi:hypothetical protein